MSAQISDTIIQILFWVLTLCTLGGALGVITSRNLFHSALFLILSFFGVTGYYVLLDAGFLAMVQLFVYIGAISVLILFAVMFSRRVMDSTQTQSNQQWWLALPVVIVLFAVLFGIVTGVAWPISQDALTSDTVLQLGIAFMGSYLIPFMVVAVLLSVALIGAVILAREKVEAE